MITAVGRFADGLPWGGIADLLQLPALGLCGSVLVFREQAHPFAGGCDCFF